MNPHPSVPKQIHNAWVILLFMFRKREGEKERDTREREIGREREREIDKRKGAIMNIQKREAGSAIPSKTRAQKGRKGIQQAIGIFNMTR
jgi:hypothetical protein